MTQAALELPIACSGLPYFIGTTRYGHATSSRRRPSLARLKAALRTRVRLALFPLAAVPDELWLFPPADCFGCNSKIALQVVNELGEI
jgi:hypothetical protein